MMTGLFLAGAVQHRMARASQAQSAGKRAARVAGDVRTQNEAITGDIEKLFMLTEALWTILKEEHGYSDDKLIKRIQEVDLHDGKLDGKVAKQQKPSCPKCKHKLMGKHQVCLYCGTVVKRGLFER